jgi:hypothetical protein
MPHLHKFSVAVLMAFTLLTAATPDGNAWRQDDVAFAATADVTPS